MRSYAIGFDFDHTLGFDHHLEVTAFVELVQRLSLDSGASIDVDRTRIVITREIAHYRSGRCSLQQALALAFDDTLGEGTGTREHIETFCALAVKLAPSRVTGAPHVGDLLATLDAEGIPYAILTNGWNPLQQCKADCIDFRKPVFVSDDLGVRKPNVHAFNVLRDHFDLPAERIWYVGDDPKVDVVGSLGAGMRAIWYDGERGKFPTDIPAPTAIVTDILDVARVVAT
jgi:FMN phosphatase YigB (HAD superfamily)